MTSFQNNAEFDLSEDQVRMRDSVLHLLRETLPATKVADAANDQTAVPDSLELAAAMQAISLETSDHREAFTAFKEKRKPNFTGLMTRRAAATCVAITASVCWMTWKLASERPNWWRSEV